jgi:hypothetical protein
MDVGRYLVEAHLREGRRVAELARGQQVAWRPAWCRAGVKRRLSGDL